MEVWLVLYNIIRIGGTLYPCPPTGGLPKEKGKTVDTKKALAKIFQAYNNAAYDTVKLEYFSEPELEDLERKVAEIIGDGPGSLPYALVEIFQTNDWKPWQYIQITQEIS